MLIGARGRRLRANFRPFWPKRREQTAAAPYRGAAEPTPAEYHTLGAKPPMCATVRSVGLILSQFVSFFLKKYKIFSRKFRDTLFVIPLIPLKSLCDENLGCYLQASKILSILLFLTTN